MEDILDELSPQLAWKSTLRKIIKLNAEFPIDASIPQAALQGLDR